MLEAILYKIMTFCELPLSHLRRRVCRSTFRLSALPWQDASLCAVCMRYGCPATLAYRDAVAVADLRFAYKECAHLSHFRRNRKGVRRNLRGSCVCLDIQIFVMLTVANNSCVEGLLDGNVIG